MFIADAQRFLFVHVQKTGGSTIDRRLAQVMPEGRKLKGDRHLPLGTILKREPELASYWTVGFVRNPWARMLSWYRMVDRFRTQAAEGHELASRQLRINGFLRECAEKYHDFDSFVLQGPEEHERLTVPQFKYLTTRTRRADMIGRQETLEADMRAVFARLDLPWEPLESRNVDPDRPDYRDVYTDRTRRRVEEIFARDVSVFGYSF